MDSAQDIVGQHLEVRRDERSHLWSLFRSGGSVLLDKVPALTLRDVDLVVVPSRARFAVRRGRANNSASCVRGTVAAASPDADDLGFLEATFDLRRSRTWLLRESADPVRRAACAVLTARGAVLIPKTFLSDQVYGGALGRRPSAATLTEVGKELARIGASWCLSDRQPLRCREFLAEHGQDGPRYAVWPNGNPWEDYPKFFADLAALRAFIGRKPRQPKLTIQKAPPLAVLPAPADIPTYYEAAVEAVGWMFHPGRQPLDWADNGRLVYVVVREARAGADDPWESFTFSEEGQLADWLELQAHENTLDSRLQDM